MLQAPNPRYYSAGHESFRATVRRFFDTEVAPHADQWDEAGSFPRALYHKAAQAGLLQPGFPQDYGGVPCDAFFRMILCEERAWGGSGGVASGLFSHTIGAPPIAVAGSQALKARVLPGILSGQKISALAITEPSCGSDVAQLTTTARRAGAFYIVNGGKTFITCGMRADYLTVAVRTGGPGAGGISLLLVDGDTPGLARSPLKKMGWWACDTAELFFQDCSVPVANLIGAQDQGFGVLMHNFTQERLALAAAACGYARVCLHDALEWARQRHTFGQPLAQHQVIRHKLVDMATRIEATRTLLDDVAARLDDGQSPVAQIAMAKNFAAQTFQFCADQAVQILGGMGLMRGTRVERLYREAKIMAIGGGAQEVMKELIAKRLGI